MRLTAAEWQAIELRGYPCDLCGSTDARVVLRKAGALIERPFQIVKCTQCGHVRVSPRVPDEYIDDLYDEDYYHGRGFDRTVSYTHESENDYRSSDIVRAIVGTVRQMFPADAQISSLDIGCGLGDMVLGMRELGISAYGVDASPYAMNVLERRNVPIIEDLNEHPERYENRFDLVTCIEVIEHVTSPTEFLKFAKLWLRPGGVLFVLTGNWNFVRRLPGTPYIMPEGHIQYFTPSTLRAYFEKVGLEPVYAPVSNVWFANRTMPKWVPSGYRRLQDRFARTLLPGYGPFPLARRIARDI